MDYERSAPNTASSGFGLLTFVYLVVGLVAIFYLYRYLYTSSDNKSIIILPGQQSADMVPDKVPVIPTPYEGGEYSFNTWIYINSYNKNRNTRKHIFELKGTYFSTLLVGLGAFNNTLMVRTHTNGPSSSGAAGTGGGTGGGTGRGNTGTSANPTPPNAGNNIGSLSVADVNTLFTPLAMDDSLLTTASICDLPEIDMQRWTMITVVLTGRTIDVYIDGKLSRSCVAASYFKVDPTGVTPVITGRGGFDGYTANVSVGNYAMNPDEIYRKYLTGPTGTGSMDLVAWVASLFKGGA
jgi:hypothetical protein